MTAALTRCRSTDALNRVGALVFREQMNHRARTIIYLGRFWKRWEAPNADRLALLMEAATPEWEPVGHGERLTLRHQFEANYGEFLADIDGWCQLCRRDSWDVKHHVVPLEWGGINADLNLIAICHSCHTHIHPWLMNSQLTKRVKLIVSLSVSGMYEQEYTQPDSNRVTLL